MKRNLISEGFGNYVTFTPEDEVPTKLEEQMLVNNRITQLLPFQLQHIDGLKQFYYCVDGARPLTSVYRQQHMGYERIMKLFEYILKQMDELKKFLLKAEGLSLSPGDIYMLSDTDEPYFCYLPGNRKHVMEQWKELTEFLMNAIDHKEEQTVVFIYGLYRIVGEENASIATISDYINQQPKTIAIKKRSGISDGPITPMPRKPEVTAQEPQVPLPVMEERFVPPVQVKKLSFYKQKGMKPVIGLHIAALLLLLGLASFCTVQIFIKDNSRTYFNNLMGVLFLMTAIGISLGGKLKKKQEEEVADDMEATVLLSGTPPVSKSKGIAYLRPVERTGEPYIPLEKATLAIGYLREAVDIWINDKSISRLHSVIEQKNGYFYITDLDSSNGTYINGGRLDAKIQMKMSHQDHIFFGNKEYEFLESIN